MEAILLTVHYLICFFLILAILLQVGKGADIGAVFGGASQTVFGGRGPTTFLSKMTAVIAMMFLVTSISLAHIAKTRSADTVIDKATPVEKAPSSATGGAPTSAPAGDAPAAAPAEPQAK